MTVGMPRSFWNNLSNWLMKHKQKVPLSLKTIAGGFSTASENTGL